MAVTTYTNFAGMLVGENRGGTKRDYLTDMLGSLVGEVDNTQTITYSAEYWPYGEVRTESGTQQSSFGYVGLLGYYKDAADFLYVRARYYQPAQSRWLTVDPLWPEQSWFGYAFNSPISHSDPSGRKPSRVVRGAGARLCYRNVVGTCGGMGYCHWFLRIIGCGIMGFGKGGLERTFADAMGGESDYKCESITLTDKQAQCICDTFEAVSRGFKLCGVSWTKKDYDHRNRSCQHFIYGLLKKCRGKIGPWGTWGEPGFNYDDCK